MYRRSFGQAKHIQVLRQPDTNVIYSDLAVLFMSILSIIIPLFRVKEVVNLGNFDI